MKTSPMYLMIEEEIAKRSRKLKLLQAELLIADNKDITVMLILKIRAERGAINAATKFYREIKITSR